jgi:hypothetical protein
MDVAPLPALDDREGGAVAADLPPVIDAHVHLFPDLAWDPIHRWFDRNAWPIRYRLRSPEIVAFLLERGVEHVVALQYAHRPGLARDMNRELAALCRTNPRVTGLATVFPGEPDTVAILEDAFADGLAGIKLHLHVIGMAIDHPGVLQALAVAAAADRPAVVHAGREPNSPAYPRDTHAICSVDRAETALRAIPRLHLCVPHLGGDEFDEYADLLVRCDRVWLDTTMMLAGYFPYPERWDLLESFPHRVMYGTDFPNIPYAWDRELIRIAGRGLDRGALAAIVGGNARRFFGISDPVG